MNLSFMKKMDYGEDVLLFYCILTRFFGAILGAMSRVLIKVPLQLGGHDYG